jgi:hypothetical protein
MLAETHDEGSAPGEGSEPRLAQPLMTFAMLRNQTLDAYHGSRLNAGYIPWLSKHVVPAGGIGGLLARFGQLRQKATARLSRGGCDPEGTPPSGP